MNEAEGELLTGPRLPRWLTPLLGVLAAALVVAFILAQVIGGSHDAAAPTATTSPGATSSTPRPTLGANVFPVAFALPSAPLDVAVDGPTTWILFRSGVWRLADSGRLRTTDVAGLETVPTATSARLVLDRAAGLMWVVIESAPRPRAIALRADTLAAVMGADLPAPVTAAAALGGKLWLTDSSGIVSVDPTRTQVSLVRSLGGARVLDMAADPLRHRLVLLSAGLDTPDLVTFDPSTRTLRTAAAPFNVVGGGIAVTAAGQLWLGGRANGGVIVGLDPTTLHPARAAPISVDLSGVSIIEAGTDDLFVADGSGQLWCLRGSDGAELQNWTVPARRVALTAGRAFAVTDRPGQPAQARLVGLRLRGGCTG